MIFPNNEDQSGADRENEQNVSILFIAQRQSERRSQRIPPNRERNRYQDTKPQPRFEFNPSVEIGWQNAPFLQSTCTNAPSTANPLCLRRVQRLVEPNHALKSNPIFSLDQSVPDSLANFGDCIHGNFCTQRAEIRVSMRLGGVLWSFLHALFGGLIETTEVAICSISSVVKSTGSGHSSVFLTK